MSPFIGGNELERFAGKDAIEIDAVDACFSGFVVRAEEEVAGGVDLEEGGGGSDHGFADEGELSFVRDVVGDDGVEALHGDVELGVVFVDGHAGGVGGDLGGAFQGEGSFDWVEVVSGNFVIFGEGEDDELLGGLLDGGDGADDDVSAGDGGVVSLEEEGAGGGDIGMKGTVGVPEDGLVIDDFFAVEDDGGVSVDDGDVIGLPFASGFAGVLCVGDAVKDGADAVDALHFAVAIDDLDFVETAEVDPAVSSGRNLKLEGEAAVTEVFFGSKVSILGEGIEAFLGRLVDENAVAGFPSAFLSGICKAPTGEIFAIEEGDGVVEFNL